MIKNQNFGVGATYRYYDFEVQGVLFTKTLVDTFWLTTQGVNIISAAYMQSFQSIIKAFYNLY